MLCFDFYFLRVCLPACLDVQQFTRKSTSVPSNICLVLLSLLTAACDDFNARISSRESKYQQLTLLLFAL